MNMQHSPLVSSWLVTPRSPHCATSPAMQAYQTPRRAHPDVEQRARKIRTIAVLPPDIRISSLSAGGVEVLREDWRTTGRDNVVRALTTHLKEQPVVITVFAVDSEVRISLAAYIYSL